MLRKDRFTAERLFRPTSPMEGFGLPEIIEIEPIHYCNYRCIMCHVSYEHLTKTAIDVDALRRSIEQTDLSGKWALLGASHEPTLHPRFPEIVQILTDAGMRIDLTTNGSVLTDKMIEKIKGGRFSSVTISFDGATKGTYERIRRGSNFERTVENIKRFREAIGNEETFYTINYTAMRSNLSEISEAVKLWDEIGFDHIGFISMVIRNENDMLKAESMENAQAEYREALFSAVDMIVKNRMRISISSSLLNDPGLQQRYPGRVMNGLAMSDNPMTATTINCRPYFQLGSHPEVNVACRSPYKFVRILFDGSVYLCCDKFRIGNIKEDTLLNIWDGRMAKTARGKIKGDVSICHNCDFFRFCIRAQEIDPNDKDNARCATIREMKK